MAEDVIDKAIQLAHLSPQKCVTRQLSIQATLMKTAYNEASFLHPDFPYTEKDIRYFAEEEMAMTVEDVLARRTRILFLQAKTAIAVAPLVAKIMAPVLHQDEQWIKQQVADFTQLARQYCLTEN